MHFSLSRVKPYECLNYPPTESFRLPQALGVFLYALNILCQHYGINIAVVVVVVVVVVAVAVVVVVVVAVVVVVVAVVVVVI